MTKTISTEQTPANIAIVLATLADMPGRLAALSVGLSDEQLRQPLGSGERSATENLAHLLHCEWRSAEAIYSALLLDQPMQAGIHAERQLGALVRLDLQLFAALLDTFKLRRAVLLRVLNALNDKQWSRTIRQAKKARQESVYWQARGQALHELEHVTAVEAALARLFKATRASSPAAVVQRQLDAYNAKDIDAFMACWAADARYYQHPDTLLASGHAEIRARHIARFQEPNLHGALVKRMVVGNTVIDQELVTRTFPEGPGQIEVIAMYDVQSGVIASARFVLGPRLP